MLRCLARRASRIGHYRRTVRGSLDLCLVDAQTGTTPFLKWPGGKRWLIQYGLRVPALSENATYFEPFLGGGSLFFGLQPKSAVLSDINRNLVDSYRAVRNSASEVIRELHKLKNDSEVYRKVAAKTPTRQLDRGVRMIYLNRTAYGGIYRENQQGHFNVPYGNNPDRAVCQEVVLRAAARALRNASIVQGDFAITVVEKAKAGDFVYFDPPYISSHQYNGFARYNRHLFTWEEELRLASVAKLLVSRGVHVLISNSAHPSVCDLFKGFHVSKIDRVSALSKERSSTTVSEALFSSYGNPVG